MTDKTQDAALVTVADREARIAAARKKMAEEAPALSRAAWNYVRTGRRTDGR